jgi:hypothetical protein
MLNRLVSTPTVGSTYSEDIYRISHTGNPMVQKDEWVDSVILLTEDEEYHAGERIQFTVKQELDTHFQARRPGMGRFAF